MMTGLMYLSNKNKLTYQAIRGKGHRDMATERKAKFICAIKGDNRFGKAWEHTDLEYEYRGYTYIVTKDNNGCMGTPLWKQHQEEQERIDRMIENKEKPIEEQRYEGSGQEGFDLFWEFVNQ